MYCMIFGFQINCVVMKGLNDDEICDFVELTQEMVRLFSISNSFNFWQ